MGQIRPVSFIFDAFLVFLILFALLFVWRVSNLNAFVSKVTFSARIVC